MRKVFTMLFCVLAAFALLALGRTAYIVHSDPARAFGASAFETPRPTERTAGPTPSPTLSPEEAVAQQADTDFMRERVNVLLVGFDESPERDDADNRLYRTEKNNFRSDVLLLVAVNFAENSVHLISIPRDTYAEIYKTRGRWKINAAFAKGGSAAGDGFLYATKTVELLMGVPVTHYAGVNMEGLKKLVDAMGGVDYDVDVEIHLNGRTLKTGYQHLDGQQVLDYCRARKGISTDVGRNDRQQRMLLAVFDELKRQKKLALLPELYLAVRDDVYTNLTVAQIAALATFALKLDATSFKRTTLAGEYVNNVYNASYYVLKNKELTKLVKEEFGVTVKRSSKYDLATVKRDKAAAEAKRAAEKLEEIEALLIVPTDATVAESTLEQPIDRARACQSLLLEAIEAGASGSEIARLRELYMASVSALLHAYAVTDSVPQEFSSLVE